MTRNISDDNTYVTFENTKYSVSVHEDQLKMLHSSAWFKNVHLNLTYKQYLRSLAY